MLVCHAGASKKNQWGSLTTRRPSRGQGMVLEVEARAGIEPA